MRHEVQGKECTDSNCWCKKFNTIEDEPDMVNHPPHYQLEGLDVEAIEVIEAALTPEEFVGYLKGNCLKYLLRANNKNGNEDLEKMAFYSRYFDDSA